MEKEQKKFNCFKSEELEKNKEKSDLAHILEVTLENKSTEVKDLKLELSKALTEVDNIKGNLKEIQGYQFRCKSCEYEASTESLLKEHMMKHEPTCKFCESKFKTSQSLEKHTCKLSINNSEYKQFYLKNWILTHGCTAIFDKHQSKETAILHNDACMTHVCPCRELPGWHEPGDSMHDEKGIFHAARQEFIENGVVHWSALCQELED